MKSLTTLLMLTAAIGAVLACEEPPPPPPLKIVFFQSPTCQECKKVKDALPAIEKKWGRRIEIISHSLSDLAAFERLIAYEDHYKVRVPHPPAIFVGTDALVGAEAILKALDAAIANALKTGHKTFIPAPTTQPEK